jgi:hypothetical protein
MAMMRSIRWSVGSPIQTAQEPRLRLRVSVRSDPPEIGRLVVGPLDLEPKCPLELDPGALMIPVVLINDALDPVERRLPYSDGAGAPAPAPRVSPP